KLSRAAPVTRSAVAGSAMSPSTVSTSGSPEGPMVRAAAATAQPRPRYPATRPAPMPREAPVMTATLPVMTPLLLAREDLQEEQEHVQDVQEDRRGQQRRGADLLRTAEALEVDHGEAGEDDQAEHGVDQRAAGDADEDQQAKRAQQPDRELLGPAGG